MFSGGFRNAAWCAGLVLMCAVTSAYGDTPEAQYLAPRLVQSPTIDGKLDEWSRVPRLLLGVDHAQGHYGGSSDLSAICQWAWDDHALYFAATVRDDRFEFLADVAGIGRMWQFDSIQMSFDAGNNARSPGYDSDDYEYGFGLAGGAGKAHRWHTGNNLVLGVVPRVTVAVRPDETGHAVHYEVAVPWTDISPFSPAQKRCGMTLTINDNDGKPMGGWLQWTPGIASAKDPSAFGKLQLIDSPPAGDKLIAYLIARRDLSGRQDARFELNVLSAEPLGAVEAAWLIETGGKRIRQGNLTGQLTESSAKIAVDMQIGDLPDGNYAFTMSLTRSGTELASVSEPFVRFSSASLAEQLATLKQRQHALLAKAQGIQESGRSLLLPRATLATVGEFLTFTDDDLKKDRNIRAHKVLNELKVMLDGAEAEITDLQAHPARDFVIPDFAQERLTVRDGAF